MKTIIVPLDGSALAEQVLPHVRLYASLLGAKVVLVRAITEDEEQSFLLRHAADARIDAFPMDGAVRTPHAGSELSARAHEYLGAKADLLRAEGLKVTASVYSGPAAECIAEAAHRRPDALIMLATHGYSGVRRWALGSTADRVVHSATAPVFLARANLSEPHPPALRRILVPLDGSELAAQALPVAVELASAARAELVLLQAVLPYVELAPAFAPLGRPIAPPADALDDEHERAIDMLRYAAERIGRPELTVTPVAEVGYPADVILDEAGRQHADLVVMATHGRSGIRRWLLGSVADKVLHGARTPLLLVRAAAG